MSLFPTNASQVQAFAGALYGVQVGTVTMAQVNNDIQANGGLAKTLNSYYAASFGSLPTASVAASVAANLGLTGDALASGTAYVLAQLNGTAPDARGALISSIVNLFSSLASDATFGAAATAWNAKVAAAVTYTGSTNVAIGTVVAPAAQVFKLTTGADIVNGTDGDDTIDGFDLNTVSNTLSTADVINGGAGTDTLRAYIPTASSNLTPNMTGVENVILTADGTTTINLAQSTGVTSLTNQNSAFAVTFSNIDSTAVALNVMDQESVATTFTFKAAAVSGSADAANLTLNNVVSSPVSIAGVETVNITSTGAANSISTLTAAAAKSITVAGDESLTITNALPSSVSTVDASALTAALTFTTTQTTAMTVTGGAGNDVVTLNGSSTNDVVNTGAGNDRVVIGGTLATTDTINGGEGTDTLMSTSTLLTNYTKPTTATITNFEAIRVSDPLGANLTTANIQSGIATVVLDSALAAARTITFEAGSRTVTQNDTQAQALTVADTGTAINDVLTLNIGATVAAVDVLSHDVVVTGFETVNVNTSTTAAATQEMGTIGVTPDTGGAVVLNFAGNNSVTTGVITATSATTGSVTASGLTGTASFTNVGQMVGISSVVGSANSDTIVTAATSTTVDGGAGNDNITGGAGNDNIVAGSGNDTINGAAGNDLIDGGDGNDSITAGAGNDTVLGGEGNDTIVFGAELTAGDSIDGGAGTDTLSITNASLTALNALTISQVVALNERISNVERVTLSDALDAGTFDVTRLDGASFVTLAGPVIAGMPTTGGAYVGNETITGFASGSTVVRTTANSATNVDDVLTLALADNTGATDTINYTMTQAADANYGVLSVAGIETVNLTINEATANSAVRVGTLGLTVSSTDGTTTRAVTVNVSGTEALTVDTAIAAAVINASGLTGAFTMAEGNALAQTITGGAGNDSLVGGNGVDVITGGAGNDTIVLNDTDSVSDTVIFAATAATNGSDTITGFKVGSPVTSSAGGDVLNLSAYLPSATVQDASGTAGIQAYASDSLGEIALSNKVAIVSADAITSVNEAAEIAALFGATKAFTLAADSKAVVMSVQVGSATAYLWGIENDSIAAVSANDVKLLGTITLSAVYADGAVVAANFGL